MFDKIKSLLLSVKDYVAEDGSLLKAKVEEDVINGDKNLLKLLLDNEITKKYFL